MCAFDFKVCQVSLRLQQFAQKVINSCKKATWKFVQKTALQNVYLSIFLPKAPFKGHWKIRKACLTSKIMYLSTYYCIMYGLVFDLLFGRWRTELETVILARKNSTLFWNLQTLKKGLWNSNTIQSKGLGWPPKRSAFSPLYLRQCLRYKGHIEKIFKQLVKVI